MIKILKGEYDCGYINHTKNMSMPKNKKTNNSTNKALTQGNNKYSDSTSNTYSDTSSSEYSKSSNVSPDNVPRKDGPGGEN